MSKLLKFKKWVTVPEAARHLSTTFEEEIHESDVLQLAFDRHLKLSVYFVNHTNARCGNIVPLEEAQWRVFPTLIPAAVAELPKEPPANLKHLPKYMAAWNAWKKIPKKERINFTISPKSLCIPGGRFLNLEEAVKSIEGVWDLSMIGSELLDIEHAFHQLTGGPALTLVCLDGTFVERPNNVMCQLQSDFDDNEYQAGSRAALKQLKQYIAENNIAGPAALALVADHAEKREKLLETRKSRPPSNKYFPAGGLPPDAIMVVRSEALKEFVDSVNHAPKNTETAAQRRDRLKARVLHERSKGTKAFLRAVAQEEKISITRLKQIIAVVPVESAQWPLSVTAKGQTGWKNTKHKQ